MNKIYENKTAQTIKTNLLDGLAYSLEPTDCEYTAGEMNTYLKSMWDSIIEWLGDDDEYDAADSFKCVSQADWNATIDSNY